MNTESTLRSLENDKRIAQLEADVSSLKRDLKAALQVLRYLTGDPDGELQSIREDI